MRYCFQVSGTWYEILVQVTWTENWDRVPGTLLSAAE